MFACPPARSSVLESAFPMVRPQHADAPCSLFWTVSPSPLLRPMRSSPILLLFYCSAASEYTLPLRSASVLPPAILGVRQSCGSLTRRRTCKFANPNCSKALREMCAVIGTGTYSLYPKFPLHCSSMSITACAFAVACCPLVMPNLVNENPACSAVHGRRSAQYHVMTFRVSSSELRITLITP